MLDEQADQIFTRTDVLAERVRKIGHTKVKTISHISKLQTIDDNSGEFVSPHDMLRELVEDIRIMAGAVLAAHALCEFKKDGATARLLEVFIDETERRIWFLCESSLGADNDGH
jgi:starvation-inducible DNA-binding protein